VDIRAVIFGFFVILAATLNFGFVLGDLDDPTVHVPYELFAAVVVNLVATGLKISDRTHVGAMHLATSLVADLQLLTAALVWIYAVFIAGDGYTPGAATIMVSMAVGALVANVVSVSLLVVETVSFKRA
jgi:Family of unknown function (DUF6394)